MHSNSHLIPSQHYRKNDVYPQIHAQMQLKMDQRHNLEQSIQSCSSVRNNHLEGLHEGIRHENSETRYVPQDLKSNATIQNNRAYNGCSSFSSSPSNSSRGVRRSRSLVSKSWNVRFQELIRFRETFGTFTGILLWYDILITSHPKAFFKSRNIHGRFFI